MVDERASSLSGADDNVDSAFLPDSGTEGACRIGAQTNAEPGDLTGMTYLLRKDLGERSGMVNSKVAGSGVPGRCPLSWSHAAPGERV